MAHMTKLGHLNTFPFEWSMQLISNLNYISRISFTFECNISHRKDSLLCSWVLPTLKEQRLFKGVILDSAYYSCVLITTLLQTEVWIE
jgi:hypothetical protein